MARRRGEELDAAIRSAVLELLAQHGPARVTMEAVAAAARTSKPCSTGGGQTVRACCATP